MSWLWQCYDSVITLSLTQLPITMGVTMDFGFLPDRSQGHWSILLFQGLKSHLQVKLSIVSCPPVTTVLIKRPDLKFQLGFSVQNGIVSGICFTRVCVLRKGQSLRRVCLALRADLQPDAGWHCRARRGACRPQDYWNQRPERGCHGTWEDCPDLVCFSGWGEQTSSIVPNLHSKYTQSISLFLISYLGPHSSSVIRV